MGSMFSKVSYDQIYDEHIYMFSASSVNKICKLYDLELINVVKQETHGGSLRYICGRKDTHEISENVKSILDEEKKNNLDNLEQEIFELNNNGELLILSAESESLHVWVITVMDILNKYGFNEIQIRTIEK